MENIFSTLFFYDFFKLGGLCYPSHTHPCCTKDEWISHPYSCSWNNQDLPELLIIINIGMATISSSHTQWSASSRQQQMRGIALLPVFQGLLETMECFEFLLIFCCVSGKALTIPRFRWQSIVEYNCQPLSISTHIMTSTYP